MVFTDRPSFPAVMLALALSTVHPSASAQEQAATVNSQAVPSPSTSPLASDEAASRDVPVGERADHAQEVMNRVNGLVNQLTDLGTNLKQGMPEDELKTTLKKIDVTIDNASKVLSPDSGIAQSEARIVAKLQDALEQLKDMMDRVQAGQGSAGIFMKDPELASELKQVSAKMSKLTGHRHEFRFVLDIGLQEIKGYTEGTSRVYMNLGIWPSEDRYYLLGFANDPRGKVTILTTTVTNPAGVSTTTNTESTDETGIVFTGMIGKLFLDKRLDLSLGALYGDLAVSVMGNLGPKDFEDHIKLRADFYSHAIGFPSNERFNLFLEPWKVVYASVGLDGVYRVNGTLPWAYGAGITFDDSFIRYLFNTYISSAI